MELDVAIRLPELWGDKQFEQTEWGHLNFLIGPNGTGKTRFAEELENNIPEYSTRYLNAERLSGMEKQRYGNFSRTNLNRGFNLEQEDQFLRQAESQGLSSDAYLELQNKPDLKTRIQAILSEFFDREISLKVEGGFLKPEMRDTKNSDSYNLRQNESHGLKELVSLLTLIHDDEYDVVIIDESELHLHPQYQQFLLREIKKLAGDPDERGSRAFFLITHSPSMVEFRDINDLTNVYSFRSRHRPPFTVDDFDENDRYRINKLIPRLNSKHKEILFSREPVLVEGYTDERILSLAIEMHEELTESPESTIIGVGGKEELDSFLRFCRNLGLAPRIVADLDTLFSGNLRDTLSELDQVRRRMQEEGVAGNLHRAMGEVEKVLNSIDEDIRSDGELSQYSDQLEKLSERLKQESEAHKRRYYIYRTIHSNEDVLDPIIDGDEIGFVKGRVETLIETLCGCGYHVLRRGELEDYLVGADPSPFGVSPDKKSDIFEEAREDLLSAESKSDISNILGELEPLLKDITSAQDVDLLKFVEEPISDWIHDVQWAIRKGEIQSIEELKEHDKVGEDEYGRIFHVEQFDVDGESFRCTISINSSLDPRETTWEFDEETSPASINLR